MNLINYILNLDKSKDGKLEILAHNFRSKEGDKTGYVRELQFNESLRKGQIRKDNIKLTHTIISLSANENPKAATKAVLQDLAMKYMELKGYDRMYLGMVHQDQNHIHCHIAESPLKYGTGLSGRISRTEFQNIKTELEKFQRSKYPELTESLVEHGSGQAYLKDRAWQKAHRQEHEIKKQELSKTVHECYEKSNSQKEFIQHLQSQGLHHYERGTKIQGVLDENGEKFRFSRFGLDISQLPTETIDKTILKSTDMKDKTIDKVTPFQVLTLSELNDCEKRIEAIQYEKDSIYAELFDSDSQFLTKEQQEKLDLLRIEEIILTERQEGLSLTLESEGISREQGNELEIDESSDQEMDNQDFDFPVDPDDEFSKELEEMENLRADDEPEQDYDDYELER